MKRVEYRVEPMKSIWGVTIRILDEDARMAVMTSTYTGFTLDDAIATANARLNKAGYYVARNRDVKKWMVEFDFYGTKPMAIKTGFDTEDEAWTWVCDHNITDFVISWYREV